MTPGAGHYEQLQGGFASGKVKSLGNTGRARRMILIIGRARNRSETYLARYLFGRDVGAEVFSGRHILAVERSVHGVPREAGAFDARRKLAHARKDRQTAK